MTPVASAVMLRRQVKGQKALPCCRLTSLTHDALWEFGTGGELTNLNRASGCKKLCAASHWPVGGGGGKVWVAGGFHVWQRVLEQSLLGMEMKKGRSTGDFSNGQGGVRGLGAVNRVTDYSGVTA